MVTTADQQLAGRRLLLIVTLQTKRLVARLEHLVVNRAVRIVARGAIIAERFVLEHMRPALGFVAFQTGVVGSDQFRAAADNGVTLVRIMTVRTRHFAQRMGVRQRELTALIQMTLETSTRVLGWVDNIIDPAARLRVNTRGTVTGFTTNVLGRLTRGDQLGVGRVMKTIGDVFVTLGAVLRPNEIRPRDTGGRNNGTIHHHT